MSGEITVSRSKWWKTFSITSRVVILSWFLSMASSSVSFACDLKFRDIWAAAVDDASKPGAIFLEIRNDSRSDCSIVSVETPVAESVFIFNSKISKRRKRRKFALYIPRNHRIIFEHPGQHFRLMKLKRPLKTGSSFPVTFKFSNGEKVSITVPVKWKVWLPN